MSDNPFASTEPPVDYTVLNPDRAPVALTTILIICLIFGILGLIGSCLGGVGLAFQSQINQLQKGGMDPTAQQMQNNIQAVQQKQLVPNLIILGLNFLVAPMLIAGAAGGLARKRWGHWLICRGLLLAVFYVVVKAVLTIIIQVSTVDAMTASMQASIRSQSKNNADPGAEFMGSAMQIGVYIGVAFVVVWALIQLCFYLWSWTYLRKVAVRKHFGISSEMVS